METRNFVGVWGSEQNPDLTDKNLRQVLEGAGKQVQAFLDRGEDFVVRDGLRTLVTGMNGLIGNDLVDYVTVEREVRDRDLQLGNVAGKDAQLAVIRGARRILSERLVRVAKPAPLLNPADGPLIAVRLNILTRKSLGGLETDLQGRVLQPGGEALPGL